MHSNIVYGENNYLSIVKKLNIGKSAAKIPIIKLRNKVQRLSPSQGVHSSEWKCTNPIKD